ncbi:endonuclease domain-containing protein [Microbacterium sp. GXF6406]
MFTPAALLAHFDGIARGSLLQKYGCTRQQLADAATAGSILRIRTGVYALPAVDDAIRTAAAHGGELTCAAALRARGVWVLPDPDAMVHVWMGTAARRHPHSGCSCVAHYGDGPAGIGIASAATALISAFRCLSGEAFFAAYESAWNLRLVSASDRRRIRQALPRSAHWVLNLARADAGSGLESVLRFRLHLLGLVLDSQVEIGGVGRVDFVVGGRLIIEVDGALNHRGAERRHRDLVRDAEASARGYETLRFDYALLLHDWPRVAAAIIAALGRALA